MADTTNRVIAIEYRRLDFRRACQAVGKNVSAVLRDRNVTTPQAPAYRYAACWYRSRVRALPEG
jgi:hypothetical protein